MRDRPMYSQNRRAGRALPIRIAARFGVRLTTLGLLLSLVAPATFAQEPPTDVFGGNRDAQFAGPQPLEFSEEAIGNDPRARILRWNEIAMAATALDHTPA